MLKRRKDGEGLPAGVKQRVNATRDAMLRLHKVLLDHEKAKFEKLRGPISGPGEFLQLVINDPHFAWLRPASELVVQMDEFLYEDDAAKAADADALLKQASDMLRPDERGGDFQREFQRALQESPDVAVAHGEWKRASAAK